MTIVRTHYRYKRPPKRRAKAVALEVPQVVTISDKTRKRVRRSDDTTAGKPDVRLDDATAQAMPANDDRKPATNLPKTGKVSAIVTARRPKARGGNRHLLALLPDTDDEHRRRGDLADALFQEMKRQIASKR